MNEIQDLVASVLLLTKEELELRFNEYSRLVQELIDLANPAIDLQTGIPAEILMKSLENSLKRQADISVAIKLMRLMR